MAQTTILLAIVSVILMVLLLHLLEGYLSQVFAPHGSRETPLYQGGELISSRERGYQMEKLNLTMIFMILHVTGFFGATLYILNITGYNPLTWTTLGFGAIVLYTVVFIAKTTG